MEQELHSDEIRARLLDNGLTKDENRKLLESTLEEETVLLILKRVGSAAAPAG